MLHIAEITLDVRDIFDVAKEKSNAMTDIMMSNDHKNIGEGIADVLSGFVALRHMIAATENSAKDMDNPMLLALWKESDRLYKKFEAEVVAKKEERR